MNSAAARPPLPLLFQLLSPNNYSHSAASTMITALVDDSSSATHTESVELRSRNAKSTHIIGGNDPCRHESATTCGGSGRAPLMEHIVKSGESLTQISLHYSVPVSEIKRVNNIVADHEIHGLPLLRIPVTRAFLLREMMEAAEEEGPREGQIIDLLGEEGTSSSNLDVRNNASFDYDKRATHRNNTTMEFEHRGQSDRQYTFRKSDFKAFLNGQQNELRGSNESLSAHAKEVIEGILEETDRNMATVRQNLPSPSLEGGGAFHFVDAGAPDHSSSVWMIVAIVLIIFVLLPLALTFLEESGELEEHHQQRTP